jgi:hypothetical protein
MLALAIFVKLESPKAGIAINCLKDLHVRWGEQEFDAASREATGEAAPDWLK